MNVVSKIMTLVGVSILVAACNLDQLAEENLQKDGQKVKAGELAPIDESRFYLADEEINISDDQALQSLIQSMSKMRLLSATMVDQFEAASELEDKIPVPGAFKFNRAVAPAGFYATSFVTESILGLFEVNESTGSLPISLKERSKNILTYSIDASICESNVDCEFVVSNLELVQAMNSSASGKISIKYTTALADFIGIKIGGGIWDFSGYSNDQWFVEMDMESLWGLYVVIERSRNGVNFIRPAIAEGRVRYVINDGGDVVDDSATYAILEDIHIDGKFLPDSDETFKAKYKPIEAIFIKGGLKADEAYFVRCETGSMSVELSSEQVVVGGAASIVRDKWESLNGGVMEARIKKFANITLKRGFFSNYHVGYMTHYVDDIKTSTYETTEDSAITVSIESDPAVHVVSSSFFVPRNGKGRQAGKQILILAEDLEGEAAGKTVELKFVRTGSDKLVDKSQVTYLSDVQFDTHWEVYFEHFRLGENKDEVGSLKLIIPHQTKIHQNYGSIDRVVDDNNEALLNSNGNTMSALIPGDFVMDSDDAILFVGNGALDTYIRTTSSDCSLPDKRDGNGDTIASNSSDCLSAIYLKLGDIKGYW